MTLLDSNIIIYAAQPEHTHLRRFISEHSPQVSAISYVEVLGYHQLSYRQRQYFERFFRIARLTGIKGAFALGSRGARQWGEPC